MVEGIYRTSHTKKAKGRGRDIDDGQDNDEKQRMLGLIKGSQTVIVVGLIDQAARGNVAAAIYLLDRLYGKPPQAVSIGADTENPMPSFMLNVDGRSVLAAELMKRLPTSQVATSQIAAPQSPPTEDPEDGEVAMFPVYKKAPPPPPKQTEKAAIKARERRLF